MTKSFYLGILLLLIGCNDSQKNESENSVVEEDNSVEILEGFNLALYPSYNIPKGYIIHDKIIGDLNSDGVNDSIFIIKDTKKENIIVDENRGELDRNRRGIMIFLSKDDQGELISENLACFSSENEDGGVYFPPELYIEVEKGKLYINFAHGRYGYRKFTFRLKDDYFQLIGYDASDNHGPMVLRDVSLNFLTGKKLLRVNTNLNIEESGDEIFDEKWTTFDAEKPIKLTNIEDFDEFDPSEYF